MNSQRGKTTNTGSHESEGLKEKRKQMEEMKRKLEEVDKKLKQWEENLKGDRRCRKSGNNKAGKNKPERGREGKETKGLTG